jgi:hypothetical protein
MCFDEITQLQQPIFHNIMKVSTLKVIPKKVKSIVIRNLHHEKSANYLSRTRTNLVARWNSIYLSPSGWFEIQRHFVKAGAQINPTHAPHRLCGKLRDHQGDKRPLFPVICLGFLHLAKSNSTKLPPTNPALCAN